MLTQQILHLSNPKFEYRNPQQFSNFRNSNVQNFAFKVLISIVLNIREFVFRICFVLRASYFEFLARYMLCLGFNLAFYMPKNTMLLQKSNLLPRFLPEPFQRNPPPP